MELTCYVMDGWDPRIRPASPKRAWMESTPERFAYRCLPLAIANSSGWEVLSPCGFSARWNGGPLATDVEIRLDQGTEVRKAPIALFGQGTITFHVEGIIRTSPGWNLWVGGSPNAAKDAIAPLGGIIETDWSPYSFTMNWRFTRPDVWIRFEENEPFCYFFPIQRQVLEGLKPEIRPLDEAPELKDAYLAWSASRDAFQKWVVDAKPTAPADKWQKLYFRGLCPDGSRGVDDHVSKVRPQPFACPWKTLSEDTEAKPSKAVRSNAAEPPAAEIGLVEGKNGERAAIEYPGMADDPHSPGHALPDRNLAAEVWFAKDLTPARAFEMPVAGPKDLARRNWILEVAQSQRLLSPRFQTVPRVGMISSEKFLDHYYAPGYPVVIEGAMSGWPALDLWTPDYLKRAVGSSEVEFQGGRDTAPDFELAKDRHKRKMPFDAFIDLISADGAGNDAYITAYNSGTNQQALDVLNADLGHLDRYLTKGPGMLWIGPGGTFTPLHFDLTNNLLAQIVGTKSLILIPPSEAQKLANHRHVFSAVHDITDPDQLERFPQAAQACQFDVELEPGDLLYIPIGWWHQVAAVDFSIMITYTNFLWPNNGFETFPND